MINNNFDKDQFQSIFERLDRIVLRLEERQRTDPDQVFFDNQEFCQVMNISKRTAQDWRNKRWISYSRVGKKYYYRLSDILILLHVNYKPSLL